MNLRQLRDNIDELDTQIVDLLNRRCQLAAKVGEWKTLHDIPFYVPEREKELFERLKEKNSGPITDKSLFFIYREIISAAIALEKPLKIAVLNNINNNGSAEAARKTFGDSAQYQTMESTTSLFDALERKFTDYVVLPIIDKNLSFIEDVCEEIPLNAKVCAERKIDSPATSGTYLIFGNQSPEPTSESRTLFIIQKTNSEKITETSELMNIEITLLNNLKYKKLNSVLCEIKGHISDKKIESFIQAVKADNKDNKVIMFGSYPLLFS
jgi:chorismate mutase-like protein